MYMTLISNIFPSASPGVTEKTIIALLWRHYFYETMNKYKTHIILTSNLHHGWKEVVLSPEQLEFPARAGRAASSCWLARHISSAQMKKLHLTACEIHLIYTRKSRRPRIDPSGTLLDTPASCEKTFPKLTKVLFRR